MASKWNSDLMKQVLTNLLIEGEECTCSVYCMFKATGFWARPSDMASGFAACTNRGRLLLACQRYWKWSFGGCDLASITKLKIKKTLFGQYVIEVHYPTDKKDAVVKFQVSPRIFGVKFPEQRSNVDHLLTTLERYQPL